VRLHCGVGPACVAVRAERASCARDFIGVGTNDEVVTRRVENGGASLLYSCTVENGGAFFFLERE